MKQLDVISLGEMLIDFVPTENGVSLAEASTFVKAPGGAPANVAVALSRLGLKSGFMGKVGNDAFGHFLADILQGNGVDTKELKFTDSARTALAFVSLKADGDRDFMFYRHPSADMLHHPDEISADYLSRAKALHLGSISLIAEPARSAMLKALDIAKQAGLLISYDPNLRLPLWPDSEAAKAGMLSIWDRAEIIKISDVELAFLSGQDNDEAMLELVHNKLKLLLVTRGAKGVSYLTPQLSGRVASYKVKSIDTTGAGDAFTAALLRKIVATPEVLDDEMLLKQALRYANACGALTTTKRGAIPALPSETELLDFMESWQ